MANRKRPIQILFYVTKEEKRIITNNMKRLKFNTLASYLRRVCIDTIFVNVNYSEIEKHTVELKEIGNSINQITKKINSTEDICRDDLNEMKKLLGRIIEGQKKILSEI